MGFDGAWGSPQLGRLSPVVDAIIPQTTITVLDKDNKPVANARCVISSSCASKEGLTREDLSYTAEAYTNSEGKAVFKNFHAGTWEFFVYRKDQFQRDILVGNTGNYWAEEKEVKWTIYADDVENGKKE